MKQKEPFVVCLTNTVAANFTANVLLAVGAKPAMVEDPREAAELTACADAVLVNVGTVTPVQTDVMRAALEVCRAQRIPWVLDPVAVQALTYRRKLVDEFLAFAPTLVRANAVEMDFLCARHPELASRCPTLATAAVDRIVWGERCEEVQGGVPLLQQVTATGCAQGAVCAAFVGAGLDPFAACCYVSRLFKDAGEKAFERAQLPGSFQEAFVDALFELSSLRR